MSRYTVGGCGSRYLTDENRSSGVPECDLECAAVAPLSHFDDILPSARHGRTSRRRPAAATSSASASAAGRWLRARRGGRVSSHGSHARSDGVTLCMHGSWKRFGMVRRAAQQCTHVSRMCVGLWRVEVRAAWVWSALPERGHSLGGSVRTFSQVRISRAAHPLNRFEYIGAAARPESSARSQPPPPSRSRGIRLDVTALGLIPYIFNVFFVHCYSYFIQPW